MTREVSLKNLQKSSTAEPATIALSMDLLEFLVVPDDDGDFFDEFVATCRNDPQTAAKIGLELLKMAKKANRERLEETEVVRELEHQIKLLNKDLDESKAANRRVLKDCEMKEKALREQLELISVSQTDRRAKYQHIETIRSENADLVKTLGELEKERDQALKQVKKADNNLAKGTQNEIKLARASHRVADLRQQRNGLKERVKELNGEVRILKRAYKENFPKFHSHGDQTEKKQKLDKDPLFLNFKADYFGD